jgi:hypothetical protein
MSLTDVYIRNASMLMDNSIQPKHNSVLQNSLKSFVNVLNSITNLTVELKVSKTKEGWGSVAYPLVQHRG